MAGIEFTFRVCWVMLYMNYCVMYDVGVRHLDSESYLIYQDFESLEFLGRLGVDVQSLVPFVGSVQRKAACPIISCNRSYPYRSKVVLALLASRRCTFRAA